MCNACGFYCCAYDGFSGCGCDHCDEPDCWSDDDDNDFDYDDDRYDRGLTVAHHHRPSLRCDAVASEGEATP